MTKEALIDELTKKHAQLEMRLKNRERDNKINNFKRKGLKGILIMERALPFIISTFIVTNSPLVKNNIYKHNNQNNYTIESMSTEPLDESVLPSGEIFNTTPEINEKISKKEIPVYSTMNLFCAWYFLYYAISTLNKNTLYPIAKKMIDRKMVDYRDIDLNEYYAMISSLKMQETNLKLLSTPDLPILSKKRGEL